MTHQTLVRVVLAAALSLFVKAKDDGLVRLSGFVNLAR